MIPVTRCRGVVADEDAAAFAATIVAATKAMKPVCNMGAVRSRVDLPLHEGVAARLHALFGGAAVFTPRAHCYATTSGAVTVHRDAPEVVVGLGMSSHSVLVYLTTHATGATVVDGDWHLPVAGDVLVLPHAVPHSVDAFEPSEDEPPVRVVALARAIVPYGVKLCAPIV
jgi:hypothetical protein